MLGLVSVLIQTLDGGSLVERRQRQRQKRQTLGIGVLAAGIWHCRTVFALCGLCRSAFHLATMCLVYMSLCQKCSKVLRNYRRWPRFCELKTCTRLLYPINYTLSLPCSTGGCTPETCGLVNTKIKITCQQCYIKHVNRELSRALAAKPKGPTPGRPLLKPKGLSGPGEAVTEEGRGPQPLSQPPEGGLLRAKGAQSGQLSI